MGYDRNAHYEIEAFDVEYRQVGDLTLLARIYRPKAPGTYPGLIEIHGGGWSVGTRMNHDEVNQRFASTGMVVAALDFRLSKQAPYPSQTTDCNYATRWFKANAAELHVSDAPIGAMGSSSGGHDILLSAWRPEDSRYVDAAVPNSDADARLDYIICRWPVLDPYYRYKEQIATGKDPSGTLAYLPDEATLKEGNPLLILERGESIERPPVQIIQGTADTQHPCELAERFAQLYKKQGGDIDLELFPDAPGLFMSNPGPNTDRAFEVMTAYVQRFTA